VAEWAPLFQNARGAAGTGHLERFPIGVEDASAGELTEDLLVATFFGSLFSLRVHSYEEEGGHHAESKA
jgi:hypothetical protein